MDEEEDEARAERLDRTIDEEDDPRSQVIFFIFFLTRGRSRYHTIRSKASNKSFQRL